METNVPNEQTKQRHGFVTFWLWLGIIGSVISIPSSIFSYNQLTNLGYAGMQLINAGVDLGSFQFAIQIHTEMMMLIGAVSGILMIVFSLKILHWKKNGFWGMVITAGFTSILNMIVLYMIQNDYLQIGLTINLNPITTVIATPLCIFILWAILQIKKNGVSCWEQLD